MAAIGVNSGHTPRGQTPATMGPPLGWRIEGWVRRDTGGGINTAFAPNSAHFGGFGGGVGLESKWGFGGIR